MSKFFLWAQRVVENPPHLLRPVLYFLSLFWQGFVFSKNWLYDHSFLKATKLKPYVISVGNVVAGGTGKTPFVLFLLNKIGRRTAVLTRGYGAKLQKSRVVAKSDNFSEVGDEPLLLKRRSPKSLIISGPDRLASAQLAEKEGVEVVILDDGLQKRSIFRDLEIILLNANDPLGGGHFIPRGFLRDFPSRIREADLVVFTDIRDEAQFLHLKKRFGIKEAAGMRRVISRIVADRKEIFLKKGAKVAAFSAIAHPESFVSLLQESGFEVVDTLFGFDHSTFSDIHSFSQRATRKGAQIILCTEKDAVKHSNAYVEIDLAPVFGEMCIAKIYDKINNKKYERN